MSLVFKHQKIFFSSLNMLQQWETWGSAGNNIEPTVDEIRLNDKLLKYGNKGSKAAQFLISFSCSAKKVKMIYAKQ